MAGNVNIPTVLRVHAAFEAEQDTSNLWAWPLPEPPVEGSQRRGRETAGAAFPEPAEDNDSSGGHEHSAKRRRMDEGGRATGSSYVQPVRAAVQPAATGGDKGGDKPKKGKSAKDKQEAMKANSRPHNTEKQVQQKGHIVHFHSTDAIASARAGKNLKTNRQLTWRDVLYGGAKNISVQPSLDAVPRDPRSMRTLFLMPGNERPLHVVVERKGAIPEGIDAHASPVWSRAVYAAGLDEKIPDELCRAVFQQRRSTEASPVERVWVGELTNKSDLDRVKKVSELFQKKLGHVLSSIADASLDVDKAQPYALFDTVVAQVYGPAIPKEYAAEQVANLNLFGIVLRSRTEYTATFGSTAVFMPTSVAEAVEGVVEKLSRGEGKFKQVELDAAISAMLPRLSLTASALLGLPAKAAKGKGTKLSELARPGRQVSEDFRGVSAEESAKFSERDLGKRVVVFQTVPVEDKDDDVLKNDDKPMLGGSILAVRIGNEDVEQKPLPASVTSLLINQELRRLNLVNTKGCKTRPHKLRVWAGLVLESDSFYVATKKIQDMTT